MFSDPWLFAQPIFYPDSNNPPIEVSGNLTPRLDHRCLPCSIHTSLYSIWVGSGQTRYQSQRLWLRIRWHRPMPPLQLVLAYSEQIESGSLTIACI